MTEWMMEHWVVEAVCTIVGGLLLARVLCMLAEFMDRDQ